MIYVIMMEESLSDFDRNIGRGEIIGVFEDLDIAIEQIKNKNYDDNCVIYEMNINQIYIDVNDIFKCVWRNDL